MIEPTQSFYAIIAGFSFLFLISGFSWVFVKLANKVDSIAVVQAEHQSKHDVNDVNIKHIQDDIEFLEDKLNLTRVKYNRGWKGTQSKG